MGVSSTDFEEPSGLELVHGTQETGRRQQAPAPRSKDRRGCDGEVEDEEEDGDEHEGELQGNGATEHAGGIVTDFREPPGLELPHGTQN